MSGLVLTVLKKDCNTAELINVKEMQCELVTRSYSHGSRV